MAEPATKTKHGRIKLAYHEQERAIDEVFDVPYIGAAPEVIVLGVDKIEGAGMGEFVNRWRYCLVWR